LQEEEEEIEEEEEAAATAEEPSHPLMVEVTTEFEHIECLRESPLRAMLSLKAEENYPMPKPNLDIVVVLNRSTSEEGRICLALFILEFCVHFHY
jgi:hypothetical protein